MLLDFKINKKGLQLRVIERRVKNHGNVRKAEPPFNIATSRSSRLH
jgi:hypothetical protein